MGLLKETMQAITRIDRNLEQLKIQYAIDNGHCGKTLNHEDHRVRPIEQVRSESREKTSKTFAYTEIKSIGGRICAIREYLGLLQSQLAERLAVNSSYISKLERGTSMPSETLIRLLSLLANIDETWLATGQLPQAPEVLVKSIITCKVIPQSGCYEGTDTIRDAFLRGMPKGANLRLDSESGRDYSQSAQ